MRIVKLVTILTLLVARQLLLHPHELVAQVKCIAHNVCFEHPPHLESALCFHYSVDFQEAKLSICLSLEYNLLFLRDIER